MAQMVKNLSAMQEAKVRSLGREDPLEKEIATHSSILAWRIPWTEKPSGLQSMGSQRVGHDWVTSLELNYLDFRGLLSNGSDLVAKSCLTLVTPQTVVCQTPLSMGFPRQEYWIPLPFFFIQRIFLTQGSTHISCLAGRFFSIESPESFWGH